MQPLTPIPHWGGVRGTIPRPLGPQPNALPTELTPPSFGSEYDLLYGNSEKPVSRQLHERAFVNFPYEFNYHWVSTHLKSPL